jgi:hypothetical protein
MLLKQYLCCARIRITIRPVWERQLGTFMPLMGFEPEIPAQEQPQTYAVDRAATGVDVQQVYSIVLIALIWLFGILLCISLLLIYT